MNVHGDITAHDRDDMGSFELEERYRILRDLPDGLLVAPEVKHRPFDMGERSLWALAYVRRPVQWPVPPRALPRTLYDAPSLIDEDRWEEERQELREQGV